MPVDDQPARRHLDGAHVLLTGATGFLGQATLESCSPPTRRPGSRCSIRPRGSQPGASRLPGLLRKPVFERWRERVGPAEVERVVAERVSVVDGDLDAATNVTFPSDLDVVIHSASTVSFDPPIDEAFETNVGGGSRPLRGAESRAARTPRRPHLDRIRGRRPQGGRHRGAPTHDVDWRSRGRGGPQPRARSRLPPASPRCCAARWRRRRGEHGKAGPQRVAQAAEEARRAWVTERLVEYGRMRAQSLGWTDVYTLTKALGEARRRGAWAAGRPPAVGRAPGHHGERAAPSVPGLDRRVQDGRPTDHRVRAGDAARSSPACPTACSTSSRSTSSSTRRWPSPPLRRSEQSRRTSTSAPARATRCRSGPCTRTSMPISPSTRCRTASADTSRCRPGASPARAR